ncbi:hypothetical protein GYH30_055152 [Glycine max]|uniref:Uncharacterized protein n=1 Tax=Glycine max TaxID=3847 RepID=A0A0R0E953_SOYBN|nr:hypothetical protein GYH30_055152 [Glycine max]
MITNLEFQIFPPFVLIALLLTLSSPHPLLDQLDLPSAIILCISKFQSDLLNQKFLIRVDFKSAKDILQKDVKNLASKQIFARWQAISKICMPPKASGTSLRGGITTVKGFKLALPVPSSKKNSPSTSGSPTQTGSSTQKPKIEGSSTQIVSIKPKATPTPKPTNSYLYKNKFLTIMQMELEYWDKNPFKAIAKAFPSRFHFKPTTINMTRNFYEFILIDSNSMSIKHFKDPNDPSLNTHSTIQILKLLQPRQFGPNLNEVKKFSVPFDPQGYTYWDYVDAWTNVFWHQNNKFKHSWLIYFKTNAAYNFPNWFLRWWDLFGQIPNIFLEQVQQGFAQFTKMFNSQESRIPTDLKCIGHAFVKWWNQFDTSKAEPVQVKLWFKSHPELLKVVDLETSLFLNQKSQLAAFLAGSSSKEHLTKNLKEVLQLLQKDGEEGSSSKKKVTNSSDNDDVFYQNEDDCLVSL